MGLFRDIQGLMAGEEIDFLGTGIGRRPSIRPAPPVVKPSEKAKRARIFINDPYFGNLAGIH